MSSLQDRLKQYEVPPPADAWDNIAAALDESALDKSFPSRLHDMQVTPPAAAWDIISAALPGEETPVVPMRKKAPAFIRYAAAAVLIGIVAFGVIRFTSGNTDTAQEGIVKETTPKDSDSIKKTNELASTPAEHPLENNPEAAKNETLIAAFKPSGKTATRHNRPAVATALYADPYMDEYSNPLYAYQDHVPNLADRYIMLMTPEGNIIRMSKKWSNLVCCVSGEEQDADCKNKLKEWQEKIASSPLATSPGNFLDILSLVGSLDETEL